MQACHSSDKHAIIPESQASRGTVDTHGESGISARRHKNNEGFELRRGSSGKLIVDALV